MIDRHERHCGRLCSVELHTAASLAPLPALYATLRYASRLFAAASQCEPTEAAIPPGETVNSPSVKMDFSRIGTIKTLRVETDRDGRL